MTKLVLIFCLLSISGLALGQQVVFSELEKSTFHEALSQVDGGRYATLPIGFISKFYFKEKVETKHITGLKEMYIINGVLTVVLENNYNNRQATLSFPVKKTLYTKDITLELLLESISDHDFQNGVRKAEPKIDQLISVSCLDINRYLLATAGIGVKNFKEYTTLVRESFELNSQCREEIVNNYTLYLSQNKESICAIASMEVRLLLIENKIPEAIEKIREDDLNQLCANEYSALIEKISKEKKALDKIAKEKENLAQLRDQPISTAAPKLLQKFIDFWD